MLLAAMVLAQLPQPAPASEEPQPITITFEPAEPEAPVEPEAVAATEAEPEPAAQMPEAPAAPDAPEVVETFEPAVQVMRPEELEAPAMPEAEEAVATPEPGVEAAVEAAVEATVEATPDPAMQAQVEEFLNADFLGGVQAAATPEADPAPVPGDERGELALPLDPRGQDAAAGDAAAAEVLAALEARRRVMDAENRRKAMEGSTEVAQRLRLGSADQAAQKTLQSDPRRRDGVVRTVTTEGVSQEAADEVLRRWGFRVMIARTEGGKSGGYLSGVKTNDGTFVSPQGPGLYRILRFDHNTVARLARLEDAALAASGHDMAKVRVTKIVFGVVATGDGYDLAVTDLEVEPLPAEPAAGAHADLEGDAAGAGVRRVR